MLGVRPCALLFDQLYELAVKGLSVAVLSEYTEGSDCSIHRDTMWLKGGPGLFAKIPLTLTGLARLHSYPCCSTIAKINMAHSGRAGWCNNPEGLLCAEVEWGFSWFSECSSSILCAVKSIRALQDAWSSHHFVTHSCLCLHLQSCVTKL